MKASSDELGSEVVDRLAEIIRTEQEAQVPVHSGYEVQCMLAQGGMGTDLVRDRKLERQVAMKVMTIQDDRLRDRFFREAVSTANLQHPNILPVFDFGALEDGRLFYTMKLIEGRSLKQWIEEFHASEVQTTGLPTLLRILCQVCEAVSYAHEQGAIHRDLKPDNIMVGDFNQVWVVDWGLAKLEDDATARSSSADVAEPQSAGGKQLFETQAGQVFGTPVYMAPEQARGLVDEITPLVDVYSAGAVLVRNSFRPPAVRRATKRSSSREPSCGACCLLIGKGSSDSLATALRRASGDGVKSPRSISNGPRPCRRSSALDGRQAGRRPSRNPA